MALIREQLLLHYMLPHSKHNEIGEEDLDLESLDCLRTFELQCTYSGVELIT
jgi:hypothetical protein